MSQKQNEHAMRLSLNQAAKHAGIAKSTLSKAIKTGKLSAEKDQNGRYRIEPSELYRVYPKTGHENQENPDTNTSGTPNEKLLLEKIDFLEKALLSTQDERERERQQLTDQVEFLREALTKEQAQSETFSRILSDLRNEKPTDAIKTKSGFFSLFRKA